MVEWLSRPAPLKICLQEALDGRRNSDLKCMSSIYTHTLMVLRFVMVFTVYPKVNNWYLCKYVTKIRQKIMNNWGKVHDYKYITIGVQCCTVVLTKAYGMVPPY